ncbi:MAG: xylulokinase, partial [Planctomycetaceae bacterium]
MSYYLGIDIGTSGTKSLIMSADGAVLATATAEHGISSPRPGWSEQHPQDWWKSTVAAVREVVVTAGINPAEVAGIGLSGQMHGLVVTDAAGKVLRPAIIWNDQRTVEQARMIEDKVGGRKKLIDLVGNVAMTSFTLTKL